MSRELDPATIADWSRRSRAAAGLPATITDPTVLAKVVTLALAGTDDDDQPAARKWQRSRPLIPRQQTVDAGKAER
jgi:hypothetical protein